MTDQPDPQTYARDLVTAARQENSAQEQQEAYAKQVMLEGRAISERGQIIWGRQTWDDAVGAVSKQISQRLGCSEAEAQMRLAHDIRHYDRPDELIMHLAGNSDRMDRILGMTPQQQQVEFARIESQMSPFGRPSEGKRPAWQTVSNDGSRVSDSDWSRSGGSALSDQNFSREWDRRMSERFNVGGRFKTTMKG